MTIAINIFWVILWVLLGILALLVAMILLIILLSFIPIKYSVNATVGNENSTLVRVSYLFPLIIFVYENKKSKEVSYVRIIGFRKKLNVETKEFFDNNNEATEATIDINAEKTTKKTNEKPKKDEKFSINDIIEPIKVVLTYPHRKTIMELCKRALKKIAKVLKPDELHVSGVVGFDNPASTGLFFGAYEALCGALGIRKHVQLDGDFEASANTVSLKIFTRGNVRVAQLVWPIIWLVLKKPVRTVIWDLMKG